MVSKAVHETLAGIRRLNATGRSSHTPRNLARALRSKLANFSKCFQWGAEADPKRVREELADVLTYCLLLADRIGADPEQIVLEKLENHAQEVIR